MDKILALPPLREIISQNDLRAEKKLGQNFLLDLNLTDKIVRAAGKLDGVTVFEIGPGPGGLTRSLLLSDAKNVIAIEYDLRAIKALQSLVEAAEGRLSVRHEDALHIELKDIAEGKKAIVANLPYNIATPLLVGWLKDIDQDDQVYVSMTLMFQKEVAERITAKQGDKAYGRLAILTQWLCDAYLAFDVPASAFTPPPKVTSSIVYFQPKVRDEKQPSFKTVEKITADAFGQRRKMIRSSLSKYKDLFEDCGLDETSRAENLSVENFINLALKAEEKGFL